VDDVNILCVQHIPMKQIIQSRKTKKLYVGTNEKNYTLEQIYNLFVCLILFILIIVLLCVFVEFVPQLLHLG
jgi:hypothetical protein